MENEQEILTDHYELLYIVPANYTTKELKPIIEKTSSLIKEQNGEITKEDTLGKLKFAYPIKNQSHGYYQLYEFNLPKENLQKLNNALSLINEILRFLIVKKKVKTEKEIKNEKTLQEKLAKKKEKEIEKIKAAKKEAEKESEKDSKKEKVSLEDLDKKLDEILDTDEIL